MNGQPISEEVAHVLNQIVHQPKLTDVLGDAGLVELYKSPSVCSNAPFPAVARPS